MAGSAEIGIHPWAGAGGRPGGCVRSTHGAPGGGAGPLVPTREWLCGPDRASQRGGVPGQGAAEAVLQRLGSAPAGRRGGPGTALPGVSGVC